MKRSDATLTEEGRERTKKKRKKKRTENRRVGVVLKERENGWNIMGSEQKGPVGKNRLSRCQQEREGGTVEEGGWV